MRLNRAGSFLATIGLALGLAAVPGSAAPHAATAGGLKAPIQGLGDRGAGTASGFNQLKNGYGPSSISEVTLPVGWDALEPNPGVFNFAVIDQQLAYARSNGIQVKIRLAAGAYTPRWLEGQEGTVTLTDPQSQHSAVIGDFWRPGYGAAYHDLIGRLAARYDGDATLRDVTMARCMTFFDEPMVRQFQLPANWAALYRAGFTVAADQACQVDEIRDAAQFSSTRSSLAFNPYQEIDSASSATTNEPYTEWLMDTCRSILGPRCVLENNSIDAQPTGAYVSLYNHIQALGAPIFFQTSATMPDLRTTLDWAIAHGANAVELPAGYGERCRRRQTQYCPAGLAPYNARLQSQPY